MHKPRSVIPFVDRAHWSTKISWTFVVLTFIAVCGTASLLV